MKELLPFIFVLLLSVFSVLPAAAAQSPAAIASVVAVRGQVTATNQAGVSRVLAIKDPLFEEDTLRTGKQGRIQLLFTDATIISLAHDTEMKLAEYQWDAKAKSGVIKTQVKEGTFRVMGGALTKFAPQNFTTETPTATIGIRGSMYAGTATANSLSVVFQGGRGIDVTNAAGTVALTRPGFGTHVRGRDQAPSPPAKFSPAELGALNEALAGEPETDEQPKTQGDEQDSATPGTDSPGDAQGTEGGGGGDETPTDSEAFTDLGPADTTDDRGTESPVSDLALTPRSEAAPLTAATPITPIAPLRTYYEPTSDPNTIPEVISEPAPSLPTDGVSSYTGRANGKSSPSGEIIADPFLFEVNWHNRKAFGIIHDPTNSTNNTEEPVLFFGTVADDGSMTDVHIFGIGHDDDPTAGVNQLFAIDGTGTGLFSGTDFDLFKASASGGEYNLGRPRTPLNETWDVTLTASRDPQDEVDLISPTGTSTWAGFMVGISENVNTPGSGRKLFMNSLADGTRERFVLTINKDTGRITGSLRAPQLDRLYNGALDLKFGGEDGSAYVLDDAWAAFIGCSGDCITSDEFGVDLPNIPLNRYGNFVVTAPPEEQFSDYANWGYWAISHQEPNGDMHHTLVPASMWVAGEKTPADYVDRLINRTTFVGRYSGIAQGTQIDFSSNQTSQLTNGRSFLEIDFSQANAAEAVTGALVFDQITLAFASPEFGLNRQGFKAKVINPEIHMSDVNGAFFGPRANAVGGNFQAQSSTKKYLGIFGGNLITTPPR